MERKPPKRTPAKAPPPDTAGQKQAPDTRFKPGVSGNPNGRPKGETKLSELRERLRDEMGPILDAMVLKAKEGDATAARLVLERCIPPLKPQDMPQPVEAEATQTIEEQGTAVMNAALRGVIPPGYASQLMQGFASLGTLRAVGEFERRLAALEQLYKEKR